MLKSSSEERIEMTVDSMTKRYQFSDV